MKIILDLKHLQIVTNAEDVLLMFNVKMEKLVINWLIVEMNGFNAVIIIHNHQMQIVMIFFSNY